MTPQMQQFMQLNPQHQQMYQQLCHQNNMNPQALNFQQHQMVMQNIQNMIAQQQMPPQQMPPQQQGFNPMQQGFQQPGFNQPQQYASNMQQGFNRGNFARQPGAPPPPPQ